ncbi:DUF5994 family protein [Mycobacterium intermedium]|uniref:DUF5994 family protein n=1 Tax=Mycobacterium intermedium TaxID=28445 RepID=UPI001E3349B4
MGTALDGAWWPRTASIPRELPELLDALSARLGEITAIRVNWSSLEGAPDLDALNCLKVIPFRSLAHQRLMAVSGSQASAKLLIVPCRTSSALAITVMRQAATLPIFPVELGTREFQTGRDIIEAVRTAAAVPVAPELDSTIDSGAVGQSS